MKIIRNQKGLTLVELVLGIVILGISATMLALTFSSALRIVNRATLYKNVSATAAASIELEAKQDPISGNTYVSSIDHETADLEVKFKKAADPIEKTMDMEGQFLYGLVDQNDANIHLKYKEYLPSNYGFIPATPLN